MDANIGWAVGDAGTILHTADGGATWTSESGGGAHTLRAVDFSDATRGYAVGDLGMLVRFTGVLTPVPVPRVTPLGMRALAVALVLLLAWGVRRRAATA